MLNYLPFCNESNSRNVNDGRPPSLTIPTEAIMRDKLYDSRSFYENVHWIVLSEIKQKALRKFQGMDRISAARWLSQKQRYDAV